MASNKFTSHYERWYSLFRQGKSFPSSVPVDKQRQIQRQFASRQVAAANVWNMKATGTPLALADRFEPKEYPEMDHYFIFNDIKLSILPEQITISEEEFMTKSWTLRTAGVSKVKSGRATVYIGASIPFVGTYEINTKLRRMITQIRTLPIAYVDNQLIRQVIAPASSQENIAVVINNASIVTHPEALDTVVLQLDMEAFNYKPFSPSFFFCGPPVGLEGMLKQIKPNPSASKSATKTTVAQKPMDLKPTPIIGPVAKPSLSPVFIGFYNALSDTVATPGGQVVLPESGVTAPDETKKWQNVSEAPIYEFKRVGTHLSNSIVFTYYVYKVYTPRALQKQLGNSK